IDISIIPVPDSGSNGSTGRGATAGGSSSNGGTGLLDSIRSGVTNKLCQQQQRQSGSGGGGNSSLFTLVKPQPVSLIGPGNGNEPTAGKPIHCQWDQCTFMCDQNYKLRTHIRQVHEKVRPYLCDWPGCYGAYKTR